MEKREDILIEDVGLKDIPVIQALAGEVYMQTYHGIHSDEQNEYMFEMMYSTASLTRQMTEEGSRFLLAIYSGAPAGYCAYRMSKDAHVLLDKLYVLPAFHGKGLGKALVEVVLSRSRNMHPDGCTILLDVNRSNPAIGFYTRMGFVSVRDYDAPIGNGYFMNATTMELVLG